MKTLDTAKNLKYRFIDKVIEPINKNTRKQSVGVTHPIVYNVICCNHFFERVIERNIDKGKLGSIFTKLLDRHYCELLYYFLRNKDEIYKSQHVVDERHCLKVTYKGIGVIFLLSIKRYSDAYDNMDFEIIPLSIIKNEDRISNTVMEFNLNNNNTVHKLTVSKESINAKAPYISTQW